MRWSDRRYGLKSTNGWASFWANAQNICARERVAALIYVANGLSACKFAHVRPATCRFDLRKDKGAKVPWRLCRLDGLVRQC
jgi:hypothetical protein